MKKNILIGSQTWAWGPASKAEAIGNVLKNEYRCNADFYGDQISYDFCLKSGTFNSCFLLNSEYDFVSVPFKKYDFVISVIIPFLAVAAAKANKKVFWVDSMSWIWNWNNLDNIQMQYEKIIDLPIEEVLAYMKNMAGYDCKIFGQISSTRLFIQGNYYNAPFTNPKLEYVGAVINNSFIRVEERDEIIISFSGQICPYMNHKHAVKHGNNTQKWLKPIIDKYKKKYKIYIVGNESVLNNIQHFENVIYTQFSHSDFLKHLNRCYALFCPCGFTTVYEGAAYHVPMVFLPETHDGNAYEFLLITKNATPQERNMIFPHLLLDVDTKDINNIENGDDIVDKLNYLYKKLETEPEYQNKYHNRVAQCLEILENNPTLAQTQKEIINRTIATEGAINHILDTIFDII